MSTMDNNQPFQPQTPTPPEQPIATPPTAGAYGSGGFGPAAPSQFGVAPQPVASAGIPTAANAAPAVNTASVNRKPGKAPWWLWVVVAVLGAAVLGLAAAVFLIK